MRGHFVAPQIDRAHAINILINATHAFTGAFSPTSARCPPGPRELLNSPYRPGLCTLVYCNRFTGRARMSAAARDRSETIV